MTLRHYDVIGRAYAERRKPDPRIAAAISTALGAARTVLNVGAGAGSYEPTDREITAVDPSMEMIRQRPPTTATVIQASAEQLPFGDDRFDAAMAVLTVHHWQDKAAGLREVRRVTRGPVVLVTFDPSHRPWLTDYIPALATLDDRWMPTMSDYARWLGDVTVVPLMIPHDCTDGFLYAYWRRPEAYLDARVRAGSSSFWAIGDATSELQRLERDLANGAWECRYGHLLPLDSYDAGYRLVVTV